jgi:hypothetical protein
LRIGISIEDRVLAPSTVLKKLAALPKTNVVSRALREIGRIERTLFMIEWYSSPELRDRCRVGLNKGEAGNKLARAVFFHERGEIRDGSFESQAFRAFGLNLVVSAIVLWNTAYLARAVESLRAEGHELPDDLIRHIYNVVQLRTALVVTPTQLAGATPPRRCRTVLHTLALPCRHWSDARNRPPATTPKTPPL